MLVIPPFQFMFHPLCIPPFDYSTHILVVQPTPSSQFHVLYFYSQKPESQRRWPASQEIMSTVVEDEKSISIFLRNAISIEALTSSFASSSTCFYSLWGVESGTHLPELSRKTCVTLRSQQPFFRKRAELCETVTVWQTLSRQHEACCHHLTVTLRDEMCR